MGPMRRQVPQYLRAGEQLLWRGAPDAGAWFTREDLFLVPFSILWLGSAIFFEIVAAGGGGPLLVQLAGIPFVVIGLYLVAGMILGPRSAADLPLRDQPVTIRRSRDGQHASVTFEGTLLPWSPLPRWGERTPGPNTGMGLIFRNTPQPFAFYDVANPDAMLRALERARSQPPAQHSGG